MKEQHKNPHQPDHSQPKWQPNPQQPAKDKDRGNQQQHQHQKKWPNNSDSQ